jgi:hypothetical protein
MLDPDPDFDLMRIRNPVSGKKGPKPIQAGHLRSCFYSWYISKALAATKNHRLSPLLTNFNKKSSSLHRRRFKGFLFFCCDFLHIDHSNNCFVFANFLPKVSKVKERGCKLNFGLRKL